MRSLLTVCLTLPVAAAAAQERYGTPPGMPEQAAVANAGDFATRMTALELALASTIAEPPTTWRLDALIAEAGELTGIAGDDAERRAARAVSTRLEGFAEISRRSQLAAASPSTPRADGTVADDAWRTPVESKPGDALADRLRPATTPTTGVLRPVVSKRPDAPSFAVVNEAGQIAAFVTPKPELKPKLDALVGRRVSLRGSGDYRLDVPNRPMIADRRAAGGTQLR